VANVAIDLDVVTTATGTAGDRGPIALCFVITTADPATASSAQLTTWFEASRDSLTPPIGTGLTPVVGDTATFTWAAGPGSPTETYSYNGSVWVPADGQVVSGQTIVAGSLPGTAIIANTVTSTQIATNTITANNIAANTITANNIATGTITATQIAANTVTANNIATNTITANNSASGTITTTQIAANTVTANNIASGTITSNKIAANTITANNIAAATITGNNIAAGTITTNNLAANVLTANTVVSTGATIGNFTSQGFWLQGNTGNARFGNAVSIGGNLTVAGLITTSALNNSVVNTDQVVVSAISSGISNVRTSNTVISINQSQGTQAQLTGIASMSVPTANTSAYLWWDASTLTTYSGSGTIYLQYTLVRSVGGGPFTQVLQQLTGPFDPFVVRTEPGFSYFDSNLTNFGPGSTYRYVVNIAWLAGNGSPTFVNISSSFNNIIVQGMKR
jgi:hypothetical protein